MFRIIVIYAYTHAEVHVQNNTCLLNKYRIEQNHLSHCQHCRNISMVAANSVFLRQASKGIK